MTTSNKESKNVDSVYRPESMSFVYNPAEDVQVALNTSLRIHFFSRILVVGLVAEAQTLTETSKVVT